jgi:hypothetical protein
MVQSELEVRFHKTMVDVYLRAKHEADYNASRYIQMVSEHGGLRTAKVLISSESPSDGYTELWKRGRLDITVEALVVDHPEWHPLFEAAEIERAKARLAEYGYPVG